MLWRLNRGNRDWTLHSVGSLPGLLGDEHCLVNRTGLFSVSTTCCRFCPYRTMRDHFFDYPLGENVLTILVVAVILGALFHGKKLPKSKMYLIWLVFGVYLYLSMWLGTALGNAPPPLWTSDLNFVTWKDYMLIPLIFVATRLSRRRPEGCEDGDHSHGCFRALY